MSTARYLIGDTRQVVATLPDGSVDLILTSPPFLALRSYLPADHPNKAREIGSEPDPASFVQVMLELTAEWRRVLAPHGSIAVEFGDTYCGARGYGNEESQNPAYGERSVERWQEARVTKRFKKADDGWPESKSLCLVPELYRVALAYGRHPLTGDPSPAGRWRVRNVVRWVRPNPPVGALGDKFRPATSDLVIACVAGDRWFDLDAVRTEHKTDPESYTGNGYTKGNPAGNGKVTPMAGNPAGAPPLDWWRIVPKGYDGSHYATFPPELCIRPIEAMCPRRVCRTCGTPSRRETVTTNAVGKGSQVVGMTASGAGYRSDALLGRHDRPDCAIVETTGWTSCGCPGTDGIRLDGFHEGTGWRPGIVLDPFGGTGTTGMVATGHGRDAILIDLDERNADLARERLGMFLDVATSPNPAA